jgi:lipopolysaccharide/colanic/teichoic acid biosynthesis glycosyltransferase
MTGSLYRPVKRLIDILGAIVGLTLTALLLPFIAWKIRQESPGPIFFRQPRPGLHGKTFYFYKFRSMREAYDAEGKPLPDAERILKIGAFLRKTSMDELPSFLNVLKGEMSLVGPRPLLVRYLERYTPEQARRHEVKPGVTGWAQINGRNALSWEEKFALDVWYVDHLSLWLDVKILVLTVLKVVKREGISHEGDATMHEFMGTPHA